MVEVKQTGPAVRQDSHATVHFALTGPLLKVPTMAEVGCAEQQHQQYQHGWGRSFPEVVVRAPVATPSRSTPSGFVCGGSFPVSECMVVYGWKIVVCQKHKVVNRETPTTQQLNTCKLKFVANLSQISDD